MRFFLRRQFQHHGPARQIGGREQTAVVRKTAHDRVGIVRRRHDLVFPHDRPAELFAQKQRQILLFQPVDFVERRLESVAEHIFARFARHQIDPVLAQRENRVGRIHRHGFGTLFGQTPAIDRELHERRVAAHMRYHTAEPRFVPARFGGTSRESRRHGGHPFGRHGNQPFGRDIVNPQRAFVGIVERIDFGRIGLGRRGERRAFDRIDILVGQRRHHAEQLLGETGVRSHADTLLLGHDPDLDHRARQGIGHRIGLVAPFPGPVSLHLSRRLRRNEGAQHRRNHQLFHNHPYFKVHTIRRFGSNKGTFFSAPAYIRR